MSRNQLFCFTYAGGNASFFDSIEKDLLAFDVMKLEYSGHGMRHKEPFYKDFDELAEDMYANLKERLADTEYALFGYSMGSISVAEVLKRIISKREIPLPQHVFIAAHEPKTKAIFAGYTPDQYGELVKKRTIRFGTVPERLINNKSFWRMYLPLYTADYGIIGNYQFEKLNLNTTIPATVFYSETDTAFTDIRQWEKYFKGHLSFYAYEGNHFFIQNHHAEMATIIEKEMGVTE